MSRIPGPASGPANKRAGAVKVEPAPNGKTRPEVAATLPLVLVGDSKDFNIAPAERDRSLFKLDWPAGATDRDLQGDLCWHLQDGIPLRRLQIIDEAERRGMPVQPAESDFPTQAPDGDGRLFWEALLRFPNAPIYGTHATRRPGYVIPEDQRWRNLHTIRVLGVGDGLPKKQIKHVYILHNGLNETRDLLFHYRLAAWILNKREDAVCILKALPGHLTRYPFDGTFSETPLDAYLRDPMDLFRQFLRYMIEMQWLLSIISPLSRYASPQVAVCVHAKSNQTRPTSRVSRAWLTRSWANGSARSTSASTCRRRQDTNIMTNGLSISRR